MTNPIPLLHNDGKTWHKIGEVIVNDDGSFEGQISTGDTGMNVFPYRLIHTEQKAFFSLGFAFTKSEELELAKYTEGTLG